MKRLFFLASLCFAVTVYGQKLPQKSPYQYTTLKIQEVAVRKDTISILTLEGLTSDEVFAFVNANQGRLEVIGQVEVINKNGKMRDYYAVNIRTRKAP